MQDEPEITPDLVAAHGIKPDEYERLLGIIGRAPSFTELGIFSAMWNEHCSYKSSKRWLRTLHTTGPQVICGPGENAGVVDLGDSQALVFKMESHNHPSFIEPTQGAATGVGGILRDVFTMGARPIAAMNALSFGEPSHPKTRRLLAGVVEGIGGYGNAFGVPTVGGEVRFHRAYNGNCLVNAFAAGSRRRTRSSTRPRRALACPWSTSAHGRGATASAARPWPRPSSTTASRRSAHRAGGRPLHREAPYGGVPGADGLRRGDLDPGHGAAGLTCSAVEMGDKGGLGIRLDLDAVPVREPGMTAYEMMLSESQERMLMVLRPEKESEARAIFDRWDLDFAVIGETIAEDRFLVLHGGEVKADLPLSKLSPPPRVRPALGRAPAPPPGDVPEIGAVEALRPGRPRPTTPRQLGLGAVRPQVGRHGAAAGRAPGVCGAHGKAVAFTRT
jgi:phosphoribosylformylglycinamidine synthase